MNDIDKVKVKHKPKLGFAGTALGTIIILGASAGLQFLNGLVLARALGQEGFGAYEFADAWIEVLVLFSLIGFDRLTIRFVVEFFKNQDWGRLRGILLFAFKRCLLFITIVAPIIAILVPFAVSSQPNAPTIITTFWIALFLLPLRAMLKLNQVTLQGLNQVIFAYLPDYVLRPGLLFLGALLFVTSPQQAEFAHIFGAVIALLISFVTLHKFLPRQVRESETVSDPTWMQTALPFMLISGLIMLNLRGGTTLLGLIADLETVALYGVGVRISAIIALALTAVNAVAAPRIARLYMDDEMDALQRLVTMTTRGVSLVALAVMILFILFGTQILLLFGAGFDKAYTALLIFGIGQLINASTGVTIWLFMMTGREYVILKILAVSTGIHYLLILLLTPILGVNGAAIATAIGNGLANIIMAVYAYRKLKINVTFI